ncbi:MAG: hypothetical protein GY713_10950 [Actinomycetia bacterium]|nr:hypothetical protein [Actinomycetes bacterium]
MTEIERVQIYLRLPGVDSGHDDDNGPLDGADLLLEADRLREYDPMDCDSPKWCWQSASSAVLAQYQEQAVASDATSTVEWTVPLEDLVVCLDDAELVVRLESATDGNHELGPVKLTGIPCPLTEPAFDRTSALSCSPALWAGAAEEWMESEGVQGNWTDPDGDCLHSAYEIYFSG